MLDETMGQAPAKKWSGLIMTIAAVGVVTVIAGAGGWILGGMLTPDVAKPKIAEQPELAAAAPEGEKEDGLPRISTEANGVIQLEPITTNLAFPTDRWVRLEVALLFKDKPDVKLAETIHQDIAVYLRTVSLQQIEGPRGFQYLKEDLEERIDMISEGKVSRLMFRTFLIQ
ncbi:flagellar basal body-associated protein FliL [Rhizobium sp. TH2]|uniref:flagellar basal body-associated FliL family protein n=1 Tax=Rhizobium sp. TH2 TaxID=2775403 RepID=UPI002157F99E|nr:flagellar basal body-associated FliL family protein [Rhizobium sp. TH2]